MEVKIFKNYQELCFEAAQEFLKVFQENKEKSQIPIMLAGGTTILGVEKVLAGLFENQIDWQKIHLFWGDEHIVSRTHPKNNYSLAAEALKNILKIIPPKNLKPILTEDRDGVFDLPKAQLEAKRYSLMVAKALENFGGKFPLVFLGMGDDLHTASLLPERPPFENPAFEAKELFVAIEYPQDIYPENSTPLRISLTPYFLLNFAQKVVLLVSGEKKKEALDLLLKTNPHIKKFPATILKLLENSFLFTDESAILRGKE
jgi:6-phosphogluconolactonase